MMKTRIRFGIGISLAEYSGLNLQMVKAFQSEALALDGYIGFFDTWNDTLRVFVFNDKTIADKALKIAHSIGFESAGKVDSFLAIGNDSLQRPHLKNISNKRSYYRELYR